MYPNLPLEFVVSGTAISLQASASARSAWRFRVREAAISARGTELWALESALAITLYYFPAGEMQGDVDNIIKPVLDSLSRCIFVDDRQIERIVVQKFEPDRVFSFSSPSAALIEALGAEGSALYIRVTDDIHGELK